MECTEVFFNSIFALTGISALVTAGFAGFCAWKAWQAQEQQVVTQQRQLELLQRQHLQFLEAGERERRINGPEFVVAPAFDFASLRCKGNMIIDPMKETVIPQKGMVNTIPVVAAAQSGEVMFLMMENRNPGSALKGWRTTQPEPCDGFEIIGMEPVHLVGSSSGTPSYLWVLSYRIDMSACTERRKARFRIRFETGTGFVDHQVYEVVAGQLAMRRIDPKGFETE